MDSKGGQNMRASIGCIVFCALAFGGCGSSVGASGSSGSRSDPSASFDQDHGAVLTTDTPPENHPPPVASIDLDGKKTVEVYDYGSGSLILERGPAGGALPVTRAVANSVNPKHEAGHLADLFRALRPDLPVPQAIVDLDTRNVSASTASRPQAPQPTSAPTFDFGSSSGGPGLRVQTPYGCNNGCCDTAWLASICDTELTGWSHYPYEWEWFNWNTGWSSVDSGGDVDGFGGTVCSAQGTSAWNFGNTVTTYHVAEATYASATYWDGFASNPFLSWVNSSTSPHDHMFCGHFEYP
jgi:hypothetical protein